tara:strand:+ start:443 stop:712 length:270 start_codon:yes stop_codon:yes gene_type:complete
MPSKYISIKEGKFERPARGGHVYIRDSDKIITLCLDKIVSIHAEGIQQSPHLYCTVTLTNGFKYKITEETAEEIRLYLDIDNLYERGEE